MAFNNLGFVLPLLGWFNWRTGLEIPVELGLLCSGKSFLPFVLYRGKTWWKSNSSSSLSTKKKSEFSFPGAEKNWKVNSEG